MNNFQKAVLTIATGKSIYIQMAVGLARSFNHWHKDSNIKFILATDQKNLVPSDLSNIEIVELQPGELGHGFSPKLHLDKISPADCTLFIDADCLCFRSLEPVFDRLAGRAVSVIGKNIFEGGFFGDVSRVRQRFNLAYLPYFVGGLYYFEKGEVSSKVYQTARNLETQYDEIGLDRLRGRPNEEPLMAIAMAMHGQTPTLEDGSIKAEPMFYPSSIYVDVLKGRATLENSPTHPQHSETWNVNQSNPAIVHFHCNHAERSPYTREILILQKVFGDKWNAGVARPYAYWTVTVPQHTSDVLKKLFRPIYYSVFGFRRIRPSERIVDASNSSL